MAELSYCWIKFGADVCGETIQCLACRRKDDLAAKDAELAKLRTDHAFLEGEVGRGNQMLANERARVAEIETALAPFRDAWLVYCSANPRAEKAEKPFEALADAVELLGYLDDRTSGTPVPDWFTVFRRAARALSKGVPRG